MFSTPLFQSCDFSKKHILSVVALFKLNIQFFYLHPAISSVHILVANLQLVAALCNEVPHSFKELVIIRCADTVTKEEEEVFFKQYCAMFLSFQNAKSSGFMYLQILPITNIFIQIILVKTKN